MGHFVSLSEMARRATSVQSGVPLSSASRLAQSSGFVVAIK